MSIALSLLKKGVAKTALKIMAHGGGELLATAAVTAVIGLSAAAPVQAQTQTVDSQPAAMQQVATESSVVAPKLVRLSSAKDLNARLNAIWERDFKGTPHARGISMTIKEGTATSPEAHIKGSTCEVTMAGAENVVELMLRGPNELLGLSIDHPKPQEVALGHIGTHELVHCVTVQEAAKSHAIAQRGSTPVGKLLNAFSVRESNPRTELYDLVASLGGENPEASQLFVHSLHERTADVGALMFAVRDHLTSKSGKIKTGEELKAGLHEYATAFKLVANLRIAGEYANANRFDTPKGKVYKIIGSGQEVRPHSTLETVVNLSELIGDAVKTEQGRKILEENLSSPEKVLNFAINFAVGSLIHDHEVITGATNKGISEQDAKALSKKYLAQVQKNFGNSFNAAKYTFATPQIAAQEVENQRHRVGEFFKSLSGEVGEERRNERQR